jgi:hypothetical protein
MSGKLNYLMNVSPSDDNDDDNSSSTDNNNDDDDTFTVESNNI